MFRCTNFEKHHDFAVPPRYIKNQLAKGKMSLKVAMQESMQSRQNVRSNHVEFEFQRFAAIQRENEEAAANVRRLLAAQQTAFIDTPAEIKEWMSQYTESQWGVLSRFKVLVLDGPSRTGKTSWAKSFFGSGSTFVIDCQDKSVPALREYALQGRQQWRSIVFDEGSWELIHSNKMLFQAGVEPITMAQSPTQQFTYSCWVYAVPMIVCSNNFFTGVTDEAAEYLKANIVYLHVNSPVYTGASNSVPVPDEVADLLL
jgi:hypothetical protein